jgi:L-lactate dehydrogenase complex protein LldE
MRVALFPTCVIDAVRPEVGVATVRVLRRAGHEVALLDAATCCGQPAWNAGMAEEAATVARTTLDAIVSSPAEAIVVPAGRCATMIRVFRPELFELVGDHAAAARARAAGTRVRELSELLDGAPLDLASSPTPVVYHHSCHMLRELGIERQPEALLDRASSDRRTTTARGRCCGFGGLFSVKLPEVSTAMADDILDAATESGARRLVGCDASCLMHLQGRAERRKLSIECRHLAEVLAEGLA